jgi:hypothetical protein
MKWLSLSALEKYDEYLKQNIKFEVESNINKSTHYCVVVITKNEYKYCGDDFENTINILKTN